MEIKNVKWSSGGNIALFKLLNFVYSCSCITFKRKQKFLSFYFENVKKVFSESCLCTVSSRKGFCRHG
jgi:hypothetical protein